jgi:hypothetical protein
MNKYTVHVQSFNQMFDIIYPSLCPSSNSSEVFSDIIKLMMLGDFTHAFLNNQCCGAGAARSRIILEEPDPEP